MRSGLLYSLRHPLENQSKFSFQPSFLGQLGILKLITLVVQVPLSALGHKQTFAAQNAMSALRPRADMCDAARDVRFGPKADILGLDRNRQILGRKYQDEVDIVTVSAAKITQLSK